MTSEQQDPQDEIVQPEDGGRAPLTPDEEQAPEQDPVTARNPDPAAASEHERNQKLAGQYGL